MQGCGPPRCRDLLSAAWWRPAAQTQWVPSVSEITVSASETPGRCSTPRCRVNSRNAFNERGGPLARFHPSRRADRTHANG